MVLKGRATAPIRVMPRKVTANSELLPISMATRLPRPAPAAISAAASLRERASASA
jgi:hypothetical protein